MPNVKQERFLAGIIRIIHILRGPFSGLLLGNLGKKGWYLFGACRVIFNGNITNGNFQTVGIILRSKRH